MEKKSNILGSAPLPGLIAKFAIPSIIGLLVNSAYNITDQIFIGQVVGLEGNAATTIVFPLMMITLALSQMCAIGTAANFNINLGAGREEEAKKYVGTGISLSAVMALLFFVFVFIFKSPIIQGFGASDTVYPLAMDYLGITVFGMPMVVFINFSGVMIRADRSPNYSMISLVSGAVINVGLDALFMLVFGWGIRGAALATVLGQLVSFIVCVRYFFSFKTFPIEREYFGLNPSYVSSVMKLGTANFINHMVMAIVNIALNNTLKHYGALSVYGSDIPLAVSGIVSKVNAILIAFLVGTAQGCQPIFSFNMGAKNYARVKKTYIIAVSAGLVFGFVTFAVFQLFPRQITSMFGSGNELYYEFATQYLRIYMMMVCVLGLQPISINYFTSIGNTRQGVILSLSRQGFFLLPLIIILPALFGLNGILAAGPVADLAAAVLTIILVRSSFKKLSAMEGIS